MKKYCVKYYEHYIRTYEVEASSKKEAEEIVFNDIMSGKRPGPDTCYDSGTYVEEIKE